MIHRVQKEVRRASNDEAATLNFHEPELISLMSSSDAHIDNELHVACDKPRISADTN